MSFPTLTFPTKEEYAKATCTRRCPDSDDTEMAYEWYYNDDFLNWKIRFIDQGKRFKDFVLEQDLKENKQSMLVGTDPEAYETEAPFQFGIYTYYFKMDMGIFTIINGHRTTNHDEMKGSIDDLFYRGITYSDFDKTTNTIEIGCDYAHMIDRYRYRNRQYQFQKS